MKRFSLLALLGFACLQPMSAAEPAKSTTPQQLELAGQFLQTINTDETMRQMMEEYSAALENSLLQSALAKAGSQAEAQEAASEFTSWFKDAMAWENFAPQIEQLYAQAYSSEELKQLIAFYKSDIGQKLLEEQPELTRRSMEIGKQYMEQLMPALQARLQAAQARLQASQLKQADDAQKALDRTGVTNGLRSMLPKKDK